MSAKRSLAAYEELIDALESHSFLDASGDGVAALLYAVASEASGVAQGFVAAKSRLPKRGLTIPFSNHHYKR